jgi:hypothetical protein
MRTWSLSPFLNELDVLEIRLAELSPVVDVFVLTEATSTHSGIPRELAYEPERFSEWAGKVRYLSLDFPPLEGDWQRENYQREFLGYGLTGLQDDDLVIVSDVDEVISADTVRRAQAGDLELPCSVSFPIHPYRLDYRWREVEDGFCRCTIIRGSDLIRREEDGFFQGVQQAIAPSFCSFSGYQECDGHSHLVGEHGWHFTYIGDAAHIRDKTRSIADGWVKNLVSLEDAEEALASGEDVFGRERPVEHVALERLPVHVQRNRERFSHILN